MDRAGGMGGGGVGVGGKGWKVICPMARPLRLQHRVGHTTWPGLRIQRHAPLKRGSCWVLLCLVIASDQGI